MRPESGFQMEESGIQKLDISPSELFPISGD